MASSVLLLVGCGAKAAVPVLDADERPSKNFDLSQWKLTLPTGTDKAPDEITTLELSNGYASEYFSTGDDGAMVFFAPTSGVSTKNSTYPRSELRETTTEGKPYNWSIVDGTNVLTATVAVNQTPPSGRVIVGQVHSTGAKGFVNEPMLILEYENHFGIGTLYALVRSKPESTDTKKVRLSSFISLGTPVMYTVEVLPSSTLVIRVNDEEAYSGTIDASWKKQKLYFKAGVYVIDNSGKDGDGGKDSFYKLQTMHLPK